MKLRRVAASRDLEFGLLLGPLALSWGSFGGSAVLTSGIPIGGFRRVSIGEPVKAVSAATGAASAAGRAGKVGGEDHDRMLL